MLNRDPEQHSALVRAKRAAYAERKARRGVGARGEETGRGSPHSERCEDANGTVRMMVFSVATRTNPCGFEPLCGGDPFGVN